MAVGLLTSIVLGIVFQVLFNLPTLYYAPLLLIAFGLSIWKHHFLCLAVFALTAVHFEYSLSKNTATPDRDMTYSGVVLAEDRYEHATRLLIQIDKVLFAADTIEYTLPVEYYAYEDGQFLGRRVTLRGKISPAKRSHRHAVMTGRMIELSDREHFLGVVFSPVRIYIDRLLSGFFDLDQYSIACGLTLGGSGRLSNEMKDVFSRAGILHILAVSGLHVGFVGAFIGVVLFFIPIDYRAKLVIVICALIMYAGVTGFRPSVCRATLMAFMFSLALVSQRNVGGMHIVNITAIAFLLCKPTLLFDVGAQLSFAAVYGILYLFPKLDDNFIKMVGRRFLKVVLRMMAVSVSAQIFVAPLLIYYFNRLPTYAAVANLLTVPLASAIIFMLFVSFSVGWICASFARMIAIPAGILVNILVALSNFFAGLPFAALDLRVTPLFTLPFYLLVWERIRKPVLWSLMILVIVFSLSQSVNCLTMCASSRGILIVMPDETEIYLTNRVSKRERAFLQKKGVDAVDYLVARSQGYPVKKEFIQLPENLHYVELKYGDLEINIAEELIIKYRECMLEYPRSYFDEQSDDEKIRYALSNGRISYFVESSLYNKIFEQMNVDLRVTVARIRLLF